MFAKVFSVIALIACSQSAFAQAELADAKQVVVKKSAVLTTYLEKSKATGNEWIITNGQSENASCQLEAYKADLKLFKEVKREAINNGTRFYLSPKQEMTLQFKNSLSGVHAYKHACNGEPELCDPLTYYGGNVELILTDKNQNEWRLLCDATTSFVFQSQVQIPGVEVK